MHALISAVSVSAFVFSLLLSHALETARCLEIDNCYYQAVGIDCRNYLNGLVCESCS